MASNFKTKSERLNRFLAAGLFPREMPPPFVSADLAKHRVALGATLDKLPKKGNELWFYRYITTPEVILFPRPNRSERLFTIPNPISHFYLSREIADNWGEIRKHLGKAKCSASSLVYDWTGARTFITPNFKEWGRKIRALSLESPYLLHSDISRYYHSIYTHSIALALHTRIIAKKNRTNLLLGNRLDTLVRNGQDGQTIGLPVGPETSRVLAEIIGVAIDKELCASERRLKGTLIRFVDDITAGTQTTEQADRTRNLMRKVLRGYQLDINDEKTETVRIISLEYSSWRHELRASMPPSTGSIAKFETFFDLIHSLALRFPQANVPLYALKMARVIFIAASHWKTIEEFLLIIYRSYPVTLAVIVEILANKNDGRHGIDVARVQTFIRSNLKALVENDRLGEISWMLFLAKALRIVIRAADVEPLTKINSSVCALLLCDLEAKGLISGTLNKAIWNKSLTHNGLTSEMWLYAYEASMKGWTGQPDAFISTSPHFRELRTLQISFYNENKNFLRVGAMVIQERRDRATANLANKEEQLGDNADDLMRQKIESGDDFLVGDWDVEESYLG